jgi:hypothetical protein
VKYILTAIKPHVPRGVQSKKCSNGMLGGHLDIVYRQIAGLSDVDLCHPKRFCEGSAFGHTVNSNH